MKLSEIKKEADLIIIDLGNEGTQRFLIQEAYKAKSFWKRLWKFIIREKELIAHTVHTELAITKQEYFATIEQAEAYKAKIIVAYKGIEEKLKSI